MIAAPPAPVVGACHDLAFEAAAQPTDETLPVPCKGKHTTVTIHVGQLDPVVDGHLLTVDSAKVQRQPAAACPGRLAAYVGGDEDARRLSRFEVVWFSPTVEESDLGANAFRCDVLAIRGSSQLASLPANLKGVLDRPEDLDRFGICGNAAPSAKNFARVICAQPHTWRAIEPFDIDPKAKYLDKGVTAAGDSFCRDEASDRADGALKFTWSFEWPTEQQWKAGQRYGFCWVPV